MFNQKVLFISALVVAIGMAFSSCGARTTPTSVPPTAVPTPAPPTSAPAIAPTAASAAGTGLNIYQVTLQEKEKTPELSTDELRQILAQKSATVFDARPPKEYAISHIPGSLNVWAKPGVAISIYVSDVAEIGRVVTDKKAPIVLYCNGPFCGKSKRLSEELIEAGYSNVRRYQLGIPTWRALVGLTQIELEGVRYVIDGDKTAVFLDSRNAEEFKAGSLVGARNLLVADVSKAKDDGRLPAEDHNTGIVIFGRDGEQARALAEAVAKNAFHNVAFYAGTFESLASPVPVAALRGGGHVILLRHTSTERVQEPSPMDLANCAVQHHLTDKGQDEARAIGAAFQALAIPVGQVLSSGYCRTLATAHLAFGRTEASAVLLHPVYVPVPGAPVPAPYQQRTDALKKLFATTPAVGTNTVLVTHGENIKEAAGFEVAQGEAAIFKPDGRGGFTLVARVLANEWIAPAQPPKSG